MNNESAMRSSYPLRPLEFGDLIDGGVDLTKANFNSVAARASSILFPPLLIATLAVYPLSPPPDRPEAVVMPVFALEERSGWDAVKRGVSLFRAQPAKYALALIVSLLLTTQTAPATVVTAAGYLLLWLNAKP